MQHHHKHHVPDRKLALGAAFLMLQQATQQPLGTLIFEKFFSSRESEFLRTRSVSRQFQEKLRWALCGAAYRRGCC